MSKTPATVSLLILVLSACSGHIAPPPGARAPGSDAGAARGDSAGALHDGAVAADAAAAADGAPTPPQPDARAAANADSVLPSAADAAPPNAGHADAGGGQPTKPSPDSGTTAPPSGAYRHVTPADIGRTIGLGSSAAAAKASYGGSLVLTKPTTIENKIINGCLVVRSAGVVLRNVDVRCSGRTALTLEGNGARGFLLENSRVNCTGAAGANARQAFIIGEFRDVVIRRSEIRGCMRGIFFDRGSLDGFVYAHNVYHQQKHDGSTHTEAFFVGLGGTVRGAMRVSGSYFSRTPNNASTDTLFTPKSAATITLENNYFGLDSWYTLRCSPTTTCLVRHNIFDRAIDASPYSAAKLDSAASRFSCNRWHDDGSLVPSAEVVGAQARNGGCPPAPSGSNPPPPPPPPPPPAPDAGIVAPDTGAPDSGSAPPTTGYVTRSDVGKTIGPGVVAAFPTRVENGDRTISVDGTVIANVVINGCLRVTADRVTLRNVVINCSSNGYPVKASGDRFTMTYSRIDCGGTTDKGIYFDGATNFHVDHSEIRGCDDSFFIDGGLGSSSITDSVFHSQAPASAAHTDGMQVGVFTSTSGTLTVERNYWQYNRSGCCDNAVAFLSGKSALTLKLRTNYLDSDWGTHLVRCHGSSRCVIERNTVGGSPAGLVVYSASSGGGVARCNRFAGGALIAARYFSGVTLDNSACSP